MDIAHTVVQLFFAFLIIAFLAQMVLSWIPQLSGSPFSRFVNRITGPIIDPLDRIIPPIGIFRISFLVAFWALLFVRGLFLTALPANW